MSNCEHCCRLCRISLEHVGVTLDREEQLRDVSFHIHCGQITVLVGPNGAGKTTLLRALLGQIPYQGVIRHENREGRPYQGMTIGYVPQQLHFDRQMPLIVRDLLAAALSRRPVWLGVSGKTKERIRGVLKVAEAEALMDKKLGTLSGGELQRVLLALALAPSPDLLILDEPVSGVDQNGQALFLKTVDRLRAERHLAVLLVSHDWGLVARYADSVVLLNKTVLAEGTPQAVFQSEDFLSAFPLLPAFGGSRP